MMWTLLAVSVLIFGAAWTLMRRTPPHGGRASDRTVDAFWRAQDRSDETPSALRELP